MTVDSQLNIQLLGGISLFRGMLYRSLQELFFLYKLYIKGKSPHYPGPTPSVKMNSEERHLKISVNQPKLTSP